MLNTISISSFRDSSAGSKTPQYGNLVVTSRLVKQGFLKFSSREILSQLGKILEHPEEYVQEEKLPGQLSSHMLEKYVHGKYEIQLRSSRDKYYLRRWYISRVLKHGNIGNNERILATMVFSGYTAMEQLFFFLIHKIKNRNADLVIAAWELSRSLYPNFFPILPNVQDPRTAPKFGIVVEHRRPQRVQVTHRVRNPSAVGGKRRQGLSSLPAFQSGDPGPSNVAEIFLSMMNFLESKNHDPYEGTTGWPPGCFFPFTEEDQKSETDKSK